MTLRKWFFITLILNNKPFDRLCVLFRQEVYFFLHFVPLDNQQFERLNCYSSPSFYFSISEEEKTTRERALQHVLNCVAQVALDRQTRPRQRWFLWIAIESRLLHIWKGISWAQKKFCTRHRIPLKTGQLSNEISCIARPSNTGLFIGELHLFFNYETFFRSSGGLSIATHSACCLISC